MSEERWTLPKAWKWAKAGEIAEIIGGGTPPSRDTENFQENGIPWLTPADLTGYKETYISRGKRDLSQKGYNASGAKIMPKGTVLFSSRAPIGYCAIASNPVSTNQGFKSLVLMGGLLPEFVRYYLIASKEYAESISSGTTFKELSGGRMSTMLIPLPPLNEQHRIVAKLDKLFTRSRCVREELEPISKLIKRYKQAVLSKAFRGELVPQDPNDVDFSQPDRVPAAVLLERILSEKKKQPNSKRVGGGSVSELPRGWTKCKLPEFCELIMGQSPPSDTYNSDQLGIPFYQGKTEFGILYPTPVKYCSKPNKIALSGDILISVRAPVGPTNICPHKACIGRGLAAIRPLGKVQSKFVLFLFRSIEAFLSQQGQGTTFKAITKDFLDNLEIPLPPLNEQNRIVTKLEKLFKAIDKVDQEYQKAIKLCTRLEQAALTKAFRGELVPQDPKDVDFSQPDRVPAAVLLERILSEKQKQPTSKRVQSKKKND